MTMETSTKLSQEETLKAELTEKEIIVAKNKRQADMLMKILMPPASSFRHM